MTRFVLALAVAGVAALAPASRAQQPGGPPMGGMGMAPGGPASMLLSQTGDLKLSDAQVTRLAAIARRTSDRHSAMQLAMRNSMDSMQKAMQASPPSANGARPRMMMMPPAGARAQMERARQADHDDLRDALAVLTPDQQATAFERASMRGAHMRRGAGMFGRGVMGGRMGQGDGAGQMRPPMPGMDGADGANMRPRAPRPAPPEGQ